MIGVNRRRVMGSGGSILPAGYIQVEYIENTSTAYIDTGIVCDTQLVYETESRLLGMGAEGINDGAKYFFFGARNNVLYLGVQNKVLDSRDPYDDGAFHRYVLDNVNGILLKDGSTVIQASVSSTSTLKFNLFRTNIVSGNTYNINMKKRTAILRIGNTVVRNYIPCMSPDNIVGMYDTIGKQFYYSPNGISFVAGNPV